MSELTPVERHTSGDTTLVTAQLTSSTLEARNRHAGAICSETDGGRHRWPFSANKVKRIVKQWTRQAHVHHLLLLAGFRTRPIVPVQEGEAGGDHRLWKAQQFGRSTQQLTLVAVC